MKLKNKDNAVVVGMGYVGFPLACILGRSGYSVTGIDVNEERILLINSGKLPFVYYEKGIKELFSQSKLKATKDYKVCLEAKLIIIAVQTPVNESSHQPEYRFLKSALKSVGTNLRKGSLVIIESTIAPGTTEKVVVPVLEEYSKLTAGKDFWIAHCPERISANETLVKLQKMPRVIGGHTPQAGEMACDVYKKFVKNHIDSVDALTAEVIKTAENTYRDVQIAFANQLEDICHLYGVDFWKIRDLINKMPERNLHRAGPGVGGHCIPKDPWLLISGVDRTRSGLVRMARKINQRRPQILFDRLKLLLLKKNIPLKKAKIALLGVSYFPKIDDIRNSPTLEFAKILDKENIKYRMHDPDVKLYQTDLAGIVEWADAVSVMTGQAAYRDLPKNLLKRKIVLDPRHTL